jgi:hypothetical protein
MVLRGHFPQSYVDAWEKVMVGTPFKYTDPKGVTSQVSYEVGNPMGFYSS